MARLTSADVQNGKAIPQPGDIVGNLQYRGRDPSDLAHYQPLDGSPALSGSIFDLDAAAARPSNSADASQPARVAPALSGVKMLLPDISAPFAWAQGTVPPQTFGSSASPSGPIATMNNVPGKFGPLFSGRSAAPTAAKLDRFALHPEDARPVDDFVSATGP